MEIFFIKLSSQIKLCIFYLTKRDFFLPNNKSKSHSIQFLLEHRLNLSEFDKGKKF